MGVRFFHKEGDFNLCSRCFKGIDPTDEEAELDKADFVAIHKPGDEPVPCDRSTLADN